MGYLVATAVRVFTFGHVGDRYGWDRMDDAGFAIFTISPLEAGLG